MAKVVSLAMGLKSKNVLYAAGFWLHQEGMVTERCLQLSKFLVKDYILLLSSEEQPFADLKTLPEVSPLFAANFLTSVTEVYYTEDNVQDAPPEQLLQLVTHWLSENPALALTSVLNPSQTASPQVQVTQVLIYIYIYIHV